MEVLQFLGELLMVPLVPVLVKLLPEGGQKLSQK